MKKITLTILLTLAFYLIHVSVMPHLAILGITGNISFAYMAIISVTYSLYFAYISGAIFGIIMEIMLSPFDMLNLLIYPILALIGAYLFGDKSERYLSQKTTPGKEPTKNISPFIRIPLCSGMMTLINELIKRLYINLSGFEITFYHIVRAMISVAYSMALAAALMIPIRKLLGIKRLTYWPE